MLKRFPATASFHLFRLTAAPPSYSIGIQRSPFLT
jgi:hypothetical protein